MTLIAAAIRRRRRARQQHRPGTILTAWDALPPSPSGKVPFPPVRSPEFADLSDLVATATTGR
jgi:hypothetical protein